MVVWAAVVVGVGLVDWAWECEGVGFVDWEEEEECEGVWEKEDCEEDATDCGIDNAVDVDGSGCCCS